MDIKATVRTTESVPGVKYLQSWDLYLSHNHKKLQLIFCAFQIFLSSTYLFSKDKFWLIYIKKRKHKKQNKQTKKPLTTKPINQRNPLHSLLTNPLKVWVYNLVKPQLIFIGCSVTDSNIGKFAFVLYNVRRHFKFRHIFR